MLLAHSPANFDLVAHGRKKNDWLTDLIIGWLFFLTDKWPDWIVDYTAQYFGRFSFHHYDLMIDWLIDWLPYLLIVSKVVCLSICLSDWLTD